MALWKPLEMARQYLNKKEEESRLGKDFGKWSDRPGMAGGSMGQWADAMHQGVYFPDNPNQEKPFQLTAQDAASQALAHMGHDCYQRYYEAMCRGEYDVYRTK